MATSTFNKNFSLLAEEADNFCKAYQFPARKTYNKKIESAIVSENKYRSALSKTLSKGEESYSNTIK